MDLTFIPDRSAEWTKIPSLVEAYWDVIEYNIRRMWNGFQNRVVPLQDQFCEHYFDVNESQIENYSQTVQQGIKGRVLRSYPSLVRESHFGSLVGDILANSDGSVESFTILSETDIDMEQGVDLVLILNGCPFSISITKTDSGTDWEKIKAERKKGVTNPHPIKLVMNSENTYEIGTGNNPMWLFKRSTVNGVIQNCLEIAQDGD